MVIIKFSFGKKSFDMFFYSIILPTLLIIATLSVGRQNPQAAQGNDKYIGMPHVR
jgi:hypothetical protein